jgi:hypothetical protein
MAMTEPRSSTDDALLAEFAHRADSAAMGERYWFSEPAFTHDRTTALEIIRVCRELNQPPDDVIRVKVFAALLDRVLALEVLVRRMDRPAG